MLRKLLRTTAIVIAIGGGSPGFAVNTCQVIAQATISDSGTPKPLLYIDVPPDALSQTAQVFGRWPGESAWHPCAPQSSCDVWMTVDKVQSIPGPESDEIHYAVLVYAFYTGSVQGNAAFHKVTPVDARLVVNYTTNNPLCMADQSWDVTAHTGAAPSRILIPAGKSFSSTSAFETPTFGTPSNQWRSCGSGPPASVNSFFATLPFLSVLQSLIPTTLNCAVDVVGFTLTTFRDRDGANGLTTECHSLGNPIITTYPKYYCKVRITFSP
jgi:hypothetical protein